MLSAILDRLDELYIWRHHNSVLNWQSEYNIYDIHVLIQISYEIWLSNLANVQCMFSIYSMTKHVSWSGNASHFCYLESAQCES
jgi:hypothetical protein